MKKILIIAGLVTILGTVLFQVEETYRTRPNVTVCVEMTKAFIGPPYTQLPDGVREEINGRSSGFFHQYALYRAFKHGVDVGDGRVVALP